MISKEDYEEPRCVLCMNQKERIPIDRVISRLDEYLENGDLDRAYSHLLYWLEEAKTGSDNMGELSVLSELMGFCRKNGRKDEAIKYASEGVAKVDRYDLSDTVVGATTILNAGTVYRTFEDNEKSSTLYKRVEELYLKILEPSDSRLGGLYNNYASALTELGDFDSALEKYEKALEIMGKQANGKLECAITYLNMADLFAKKDGIEESEKKIDVLLDKAYELLTDDSIEKDGYFVFVLDKCIPAYDCYGQFLRSEDLRTRLNAARK